ncbi:hypothetical protein [Mesorhizobium tamadayense]|nr:hypothetical protein [Mesorhizobium tamadayense]
MVVLDPGEEEAIAALTAIGAFEKATVGWFDFGSKSIDLEA